MRVISGAYGGRRLKTGQGPGYRPATDKVRQAVFSMLEARGLAWEGLTVADLFAGSGSLGIECLSRGAAHALFVEKSGRAAGLIRENLRGLGVERSRAAVLAKDVSAVLARAPEAPCGLVFVDPPYGKGLLAPALDALMGQGWLAEGGMLLAEVEAGLDLDPETVHPRLDVLTDRRYGQTRIVLWQN